MRGVCGVVITCACLACVVCSDQLDGQTPANRALFKINSGVCQLFREFLLAKGFIEVHTPRICSTPSAGQPEFKLRYFDGACTMVDSVLA